MNDEHGKAIAGTLPTTSAGTQPITQGTGFLVAGGICLALGLMWAITVAFSPAAWGILPIPVLLAMLGGVFLIVGINKRSIARARARGGS